MHTAANQSEIWVQHRIETGQGHSATNALENSQPVTGLEITPDHTSIDPLFDFNHEDLGEYSFDVLIGLSVVDYGADMFSYDDSALDHDIHSSMPWPQVHDHFDGLQDPVHPFSNGQRIAEQEQCPSSLQDDTYKDIPYGSWVPFIPPTPPSLDSSIDEGQSETHTRDDFRDPMCRAMFHS
jgi:hypothetical protein